LLQEIRVHYNEVLMQHWVQVFRDILDEDSFLPIQVIIIHTREIFVMPVSNID